MHFENKNQKSQSSREIKKKSRDCPEAIITYQTISEKMLKQYQEKKIRNCWCQRKSLKGEIQEKRHHSYFHLTAQGSDRPTETNLWKEG